MTSFRQVESPDSDLMSLATSMSSQSQRRPLVIKCNDETEDGKPLSDSDYTSEHLSVSEDGVDGHIHDHEDILNEELLEIAKLHDSGRRLTTDSGVHSRGSSFSSEADVNITEEEIQTMKEYLHGKTDAIYQPLEEGKIKELQMAEEVVINKASGKVEMTSNTVKSVSKTETFAAQTSGKMTWEKTDEIEERLLAGMYLFDTRTSDTIKSTRHGLPELEILVRKEAEPEDIVIEQVVKLEQNGFVTEKGMLETNETKQKLQSQVKEEFQSEGESEKYIQEINALNAEKSSSTTFLHQATEQIEVTVDESVDIAKKAHVQKRLNVDKLLEDSKSAEQEDDHCNQNSDSHITDFEYGKCLSPSNSWDGDVKCLSTVSTKQEDTEATSTPDLNTNVQQLASELETNDVENKSEVKLTDKDFMNSDNSHLQQKKDIEDETRPMGSKNMPSAVDAQREQSSAHSLNTEHDEQYEAMGTVYDSNNTTSNVSDESDILEDDKTPNMANEMNYTTRRNVSDSVLDVEIVETQTAKIAQANNSSRTSETDAQKTNLSPDLDERRQTNLQKSIDNSQTELNINDLCDTLTSKNKPFETDDVMSVRGIVDSETGSSNKSCEQPEKAEYDNKTSAKTAMQNIEHMSQNKKAETMGTEDFDHIDEAANNSMEEICKVKGTTTDRERHTSTNNVKSENLNMEIGDETRMTDEGRQTHLPKGIENAHAESNTNDLCDTLPDENKQFETDDGISAQKTVGSESSILNNKSGKPEQSGNGGKTLAQTEMQNIEHMVQNSKERTEVCFEDFERTDEAGKSVKDKCAVRETTDYENQTSTNNAKNEVLDMKKRDGALIVDEENTSINGDLITSNTVNKVQTEDLPVGKLSENLGNALNIPHKTKTAQRGEQNGASTHESVRAKGNENDEKQYDNFEQNKNNVECIVVEKQFSEQMKTKSDYLSFDDEMSKNNMNKSNGEDGSNKIKLHSFDEVAIVDECGDNDLHNMSDSDVCELETALPQTIEEKSIGQQLGTLSAEEKTKSTESLNSDDVQIVNTEERTKRKKKKLESLRMCNATESTDPGIDYVTSNLTDELISLEETVALIPNIVNVTGFFKDKHVHYQKSSRSDELERKSHSLNKLDGVPLGGNIGFNMSEEFGKIFAMATVSESVSSDLIKVAGEEGVVVECSVSQDSVTQENEGFAVSDECSTTETETSSKQILIAKQPSPELVEEVVIVAQNKDVEHSLPDLHKLKQKEALLDSSCDTTDNHIPNSSDVLTSTSNATNENEGQSTIITNVDVSDSKIENQANEPQIVSSFDECEQNADAECIRDSDTNQRCANDSKPDIAAIIDEQTNNQMKTDIESTVVIDSKVKSSVESLAHSENGRQTSVAVDTLVTEQTQFKDIDQTDCEAKASKIHEHVPEKKSNAQKVLDIDTILDSVEYCDDTMLEDDATVVDTTVDLQNESCVEVRSGATVEVTEGDELYIAWEIAGNCYNIFKYFLHMIASITIPFSQ